MGGGTVTNGDRFSIEARHDSGGVLIHTTPDGDQLRGQVERLDCLSEGGGDAGVPQESINRAFVFGSGTWNGQPTAEWGLTLADRGEPNTRDEYGLTVFADGVLVRLANPLVEKGNVQITRA